MEELVGWQSLPDGRGAERDDGEDEEGEAPEEDKDSDEEDEGEAQPQESDARGEITDGEADGDAEQDVEGEQEMSDGDPSDDDGEGMQPVRPNRPWTDLPEDFDYKAYTDKFDDLTLPGTMHSTVTLEKVSCGTEVNITAVQIFDLSISATVPIVDTDAGTSAPGIYSGGDQGFLRTSWCGETRRSRRDAVIRTLHP